MIRIQSFSINSHVNLGHDRIILELVFNLKPKLNLIQLLKNVFRLQIPGI